MIRKDLRRKAVGVLLAGAMLFYVQPNLAYAEDSVVYLAEMQMQTESVSPMYLQSSICRTRLNLSGTKANCKVVIKGIDGTTKISGLLKLYDNTAGRQVASWAISESKAYYSGTKTATVKKGHSYKLSFSGKVYGKNNKSGESISSSNYFL